MPLVIGVAAVSTLALSGCMGSPTYGTDKTANEQLIEDLTGVLSLAPKNRPKIEYQPRPELVRPETTAVLPPPQDNVRTASAAWPESPEQRRARLRQEATDNQENPTYRSPILHDTTPGAERLLTPQEQRAEFKRRLALQNAADPTTRRYLSEPPLDYRTAAATAPTDQLGEDEWKKERDAKKAARKDSGRGSWWPW
jgi:hypothetical protein